MQQVMLIVLTTPWIIRILQRVVASRRISRALLRSGAMARESAGAGMASVLSKMLRITTEALRVLEPRCPIQAGSLSPAFSES